MVLCLLLRNSISTFKIYVVKTTNEVNDLETAYKELGSLTLAFFIAMELGLVGK